MTYRTPDLHIVESMTGACVIIGPQCDQDLPGERSYLGVRNPWWAWMKRPIAEAVLEHMQMLEDISLIAEEFVPNA